MRLHEIRGIRCKLCESDHCGFAFDGVQRNHSVQETSFSEQTDDFDVKFLYTCRVLRDFIILESLLTVFVKPRSVFDKSIKVFFMKIFPCHLSGRIGVVPLKFSAIVLCVVLGVTIIRNVLFLSIFSGEHSLQIVEVKPLSVAHNLSRVNQLCK